MISKVGFVPAGLLYNLENHKQFVRFEPIYCRNNPRVIMVYIPHLTMALPVIISRSIYPWVVVPDKCVRGERKLVSAQHVMLECAVPF